MAISAVAFSAWHLWHHVNGEREEKASAYQRNDIGGSCQRHLSGRRNQRQQRMHQWQQRSKRGGGIKRSESSGNVNRGMAYLLAQHRLAKEGRRNHDEA